MKNKILKQWRERMKWSISRACEALGCSRNAYYRWEAGEIEVPLYILLACRALQEGDSPIRLEKNI